MTALLLLAIAAAQPPAGAQPRDARAAAAATATISGRVTEQGSGRPLPRIVVTVVSAAGSKRIEEVTDADGRYRFTGLEAGAGRDGTVARRCAATAKRTERR